MIELPHNAEYTEILDTVVPGVIDKPRCDECRQAYDEPEYYSFDVDACTLVIDDEVVAHDCTGNLCPSCTGPDLDPDNEEDPRRPA